MENLQAYKALLRAFSYYRNELKVDLNYALPVHVDAFGGSIARIEDLVNAFYQPENGDIYIGQLHSGYREATYPYVYYHEFSHFAMQSMYGGRLPETGDGDLNHGGYANSSTGDSFAEGFAVFMGCVMRQFYGDPDHNVIPGRMNIEVDYRAWEESGKAEEFAVAGVLWDLVDAGPLDDDGISISFPELWEVLRHYHADFASVYDALLEAFPELKESIDAVFINHGFFRDDREGNGVYDMGEAYVDADGDGKFTDGQERFVDYSTNGSSGSPAMVYMAGDRVGSAAYRSNPIRRSSEPFPGHFIKVDSELVDYTVSIEFEDFPWLNYATRNFSMNGMLYAEVPPESYRSRVSIIPVSAAGLEPLLFDSGDFWSGYTAAIETGYYLAHDFASGKETPGDDPDSVPSVTDAGPVDTGQEAVSGTRGLQTWMLMGPAALLLGLVAAVALRRRS